MEYPKIYGYKPPSKHSVKFVDLDGVIQYLWDSQKEEAKMRVVEFYRGEIPNQSGVTLEQMMQFTLGEMEMDHDYIQWMFPSNEPSMLNCDAPVLTKEESEIFKADPELQQKVLDSFYKFLNFLGLEASISESGTMWIEEIAPTESRPDPQWWMKSFNHNMLRVTRVLKCMRLTGHLDPALALHGFLKSHQDKFSENTRKYWYDATFEPLW